MTYIMKVASLLTNNVRNVKKGRTQTMCLSIPSQIVQLHPEDTTATVDTMGVTRRVSTHLISEELAVGDYVLIHVGFAMNKIDAAAAQESLELYKEIVEKMEAEHV
ncbi:hydrogenase expression/formation protein HypC [Ferrimonas sediminum]|uniref:Hydrogenase expression/formation protein HypC n=2 Tax=Ferrimonas sediminum TaxID=718193 RepID=A0A1G8LXY1_9GAMM|nr:hydrogenase expression/formation protein HypC [Ferrimonas sediminum]